MTLNRNYFRVHSWLNYHFGSASRCENPKGCANKPKRFEYALIKGLDYKKNINNFIQLCPSCHRKYDYTKSQRLKISAKSKGNHYRAVRVAQLNKNTGEIINEYSSISLASNKLGIIRTSIMNTLAGKSNSAGGFNWKYIS